MRVTGKCSIHEDSIKAIDAVDGKDADADVVDDFGNYDDNFEFNDDQMTLKMPTAMMTTITMRTTIMTLATITLMIIAIVLMMTATAWNLMLTC